MSWYAVHTRPAKERTVSDRLQGQGYGTFYHFHRKTIRHARQTRVVERPYFPRYLFVQVPQMRSVGPVNRVEGVSTVIYCGDEPLEIPQAVMSELISRADEAGLIEAEPDHKPFQFTEGQKVRFREGNPFFGFVATVESIDNRSQISVFLKEFKRRISVHSELVEAVSVG